MREFGSCASSADQRRSRVRSVDTSLRIIDAMPNTLAAIEYVGLPGISEECARAVERIVQFGDVLERVIVVTCENAHCLLVRRGEHDWVAVKSGFSSGYLGAGPNALARVLYLLNFHGIPIEEVCVEESLLERIDNSALTRRDLEALIAAAPVRPQRWYSYVYDVYGDEVDVTDIEQCFRPEYEYPRRSPWGHMPPVIPLSVVDSRLWDLARDFWLDPDAKLLTGFRRLEEVVRRKTGLTDSGQKLFARAFDRSAELLEWPNLDPGEHQGRVIVFVGVYMALRNARAHRELKCSPDEFLAELLLVNQLFRWEREAVRGVAPPSKDVQKTN